MIALATFTKSRVPSLPDVPTLIEPGYTKTEATAWQGMVAPAAEPKDVLAKLSAELEKAIQSGPVQTRLRHPALVPMPSTQAQMAELWKCDDAMWGALIRNRGITLDREVEGQSDMAAHPPQRPHSAL